jgi:RNA polymerase sigma factor (sigma-70 family)
MREFNERGREVLLGPFALSQFTNEDRAWFEAEAQRARSMELAQERARLMQWVRRQMKRRLTAKERAYVELHFIKGLSYREAGEEAGANASSVHRGVKRALRKLRVAAAEDGVGWRHPRGAGQRR